MKMIAVAETLFAERGIDSVSMVEIGVAADQANRSAVQYHFGDKQGVLDAIRLKHMPLIEARRIRMLDELEASPNATLRDFADVLISPLAEELLNPDGGAAYVRIAASLIGHRQFSPIAPERRAQKTAARLFNHITQNSQALTDDSMTGRILVVAGMAFHGLADWVRLPANQDSIDPARLDQFANDLTDCVVSVLETPASPSRP
jgi:AcrR family transcriptional regulator